MRLLNPNRLFSCLSLFILLAAFGLSASAQNTTTKPAAVSSSAAKPAATAPKGAQSMIETFFKKYKISSDTAIDYIFGTNKLFAGNAVQIAQLKQRLDSLQLNIGKYTGHELIVQKTASPSLVLYSYLVKHKNQPIRFSFIFYKAESEWSLYRFNFDDQMDTEMFEAAKINNKR